MRELSTRSVDHRRSAHADWRKYAILVVADARSVFRNYATLYFVFVVDEAESELGILDLIQVRCAEQTPSSPPGQCPWRLRLKLLV